MRYRLLRWIFVASGVINSFVESLSGSRTWSIGVEIGDGEDRFESEFE